MVNYKDLGLVNTREMFKNAMAGKYAIAAFSGQTQQKGGREQQKQRRQIS